MKTLLKVMLFTWLSLFIWTIFLALITFSGCSSEQDKTLLAGLDGGSVDGPTARDASSPDLPTANVHDAGSSDLPTASVHDAGSFDSTASDTVVDAWDYDAGCPHGWCLQSGQCQPWIAPDQCNPGGMCWVCGDTGSRCCCGDLKCSDPNAKCVQSANDYIATCQIQRD
jgi:hypothetical protein